MKKIAFDKIYRFLLKLNSKKPRKLKSDCAFEGELWAKETYSCIPFSRREFVFSILYFVRMPRTTARVWHYHLRVCVCIVFDMKWVHGTEEKRRRSNHWNKIMRLRAFSQMQLYSVWVESLKKKDAYNFVCVCVFVCSEKTQSTNYLWSVRCRSGNTHHIFVSLTRLFS